VKAKAPKTSARFYSRKFHCGDGIMREPGWYKWSDGQFAKTLELLPDKPKSGEVDKVIEHPHTHST
jgi:hypothetical protein